jgi:hypothetical protein
MYPWIASPAMAKVVAFEIMRAEHAASQKSVRRSRSAKSAADEASHVPSTATTRRPRLLTRALRAAH